MTSEKRKSSEAGNTAKRQKLNKESEKRSVTSKKKDGVANKSKTNKKQAPKTTATKAIKNSKSSKVEVGLKRYTVTKNKTGRNVPAKGKVLRKAKEVTSTRRAAQKSTSNSSKAQKKSQPNVSKAAATPSSVQNKSKKVTKSGKTHALKSVKTVNSVKKTVSTKNRNKTTSKSLCAKGNIKSGNRNTASKSSQSKAKNNDLQTKSIRQTKRVINKEAQTPDKKTAAKKSKPELETKEERLARVAQRASSVRRTNSKVSQPIPQQSRILPVSKKKVEEKTKQKNVKKTKDSRVRTKNKIENKVTKTKKCLTDTKKSCPVRQGEKVHSELASSDGTINKECATSVSASDSSPAQGLDLLTKKKGSGVSAAPLKRKRNSTKPADSTAKTKTKKQKVDKSDASQKEAEPSENDQKAKRLSILDLCNEIAGEIESDTVEFVKEGPSSPIIPSEEKAPILEVVSPPSAAESPVSQSKRFFPSRKPLQITPELKTSPGTRNSKWKKIKLKKSFAQNNILLRKPVVLPSLEVMKAKVLPGRQSAPELSHDSPCNKKPGTASTLPNKSSKPVLFERVKNNATHSPRKGNVLKTPAENGLLEKGNHIKNELEAAIDEGFRLHLDSSPENSPMKKPLGSSPPDLKPAVTRSCDVRQLTGQMAACAERGGSEKNNPPEKKTNTPTSNASIQKEIRKLKEADKNCNKQPIIDAGQKRFGAVSCSVCGMLYTASNPEDEAQHLLFHNQFINAVKYVGWKKERTVAEYPDGKIIMVLPDDPKYALKKVQEIREMVDSDLGFQQVPLRLHSRTKTFLFISCDKKIVGCLIAEHIQWGYRVLDDFNPADISDTEKLFSERVKAWCCSTNPEAAICGVSRIWVFSMMRRKKIASRMLECLRSQFIYGSHLNKDEIAFSDPTPDGKLFATNYCGTSQFLVYNFVSGHNPLS